MHCGESHKGNSSEEKGAAGWDGRPPPAPPRGPVRRRCLPAGCLAGLRKESPGALCQRAGALGPCRVGKARLRCGTLLSGESSPPFEYLDGALSLTPTPDVCLSCLHTPAPSLLCDYCAPYFCVYCPHTPHVKRYHTEIQKAKRLTTSPVLVILQEVKYRIFCSGTTHFFLKKQHNHSVHSSLAHGSFAQENFPRLKRLLLKQHLDFGQFP